MAASIAGSVPDNHLHSAKPSPRRRKSIREATILLHDQGFRHLLLLTGEAPGNQLGLTTSKTAVRQICKPYCSSVSIEVFPMETDGYRRMVAAGVDGLTIYTRKPTTGSFIGNCIPTAPKAIIEYRLGAPRKEPELPASEKSA